MITTLAFQIIFYAFALLAAGASLFVITAYHPVRSVLSLVVSFFAMAGIWMLLEAEFLSLILLLVYVGAVMTLFLFVVMMLDVDHEEKRTQFVRYLPAALLIILLMVTLVLLSISLQDMPLRTMSTPNAPSVSNLQALGHVLYTDYVYPFEIAGVILLVAIIAAISLAHRAPRKRRQQQIDRQVTLEPSQAVRLVAMPSEKNVRANGEPRP